MTKITNATILSAFRKQMGLSKADATAFADAFQSVFEEALLNDKSVKINGLGTFKLVEVEARKSVNVNTGKEIKIAEHYKLSFTPDALLRDKINEPLAHLETIELDDDAILPEVNNVVVDVQEPAEMPIDEPLQKLVEQAMELKDILADIQSLGADLSAEESAIAEVASLIETPTAEIPQQEAAEEEIAAAHVEDQVPVVEPQVVEEEPQIELVEEEKEEPQEEPQQQVEPQPQEPQQEVQEPSVAHSTLASEPTASPVSARDIVAEINREDFAPKRKNTWVWIVISIVLVLAIVALLLYQNRSFFVSKIEPVGVETSVEDNVEAEEPIVALEPEMMPIEPDSALAIAGEEAVVEQMVDASASQPVIDTTSPIYNAQFPDVFNYPREYTEFIDTVTLAEGSRLTWISLKQYGHKDFWVYIYEANRDVISNPNSVKVGTELRIPRVDSALIDAENQQCIDYARYLHDVYVRR